MKKKWILLGSAACLVFLAVMALSKWTNHRNVSAIPISPSATVQSRPPATPSFNHPDLGSSPSVTRSGALNAPPLGLSAQHSSGLAGKPPISRSSGATATAVTPSHQTGFWVGKQAYHPQPDQYGVFPRTQIAAGQKIPITVQYTKGDAGETVTAQVLDGGGMQDGTEIVQQAKLDEQLSAQFTFQAGTQEGIYRVAVSQRNQVQTFQFWVGPLPPMRSVAQGQ